MDGCMDFEVVTAGAVDVPFITVSEALPGSEELVADWDDARLSGSLEEARQIYFMARDGLEPVGFAVVWGWRSPGRVALIKRVVVCRPGLDCGVRFLRRIVATIFSDTNAFEIELNIFPDVARARRTCDAVGFIAQSIALRGATEGEAQRIELVMTLLRRDWAAKAQRMA